MFNLFGFPLFPSAEEIAKHNAYVKTLIDERITQCVPWNVVMPWQKQLNIQASTYTVLNLFPEVEPTTHANINTTVKEGKVVKSPSGMYVYCVKTLPKGHLLATYSGARKGNVLFDGPIHIPALHQRMSETVNGYHEDPWMSLTPMEILSLRPGTKIAKGHTVVAGLGLGYQLIKVTHKKNVTKVTLVERSQELVDWILPRIKPHLGEAPLDVVVGNAYDVVPALTADVALLDVFTSYGNNDIYKDCPNIPKVWCWGSARI